MATSLGIRSGRVTIVLPPALAVAAAAGLACAGAVVLAEAPSIVGFTIAIGGSALWCRWLDHQQEH